jgi:hypothetical protein
MHQIDSDGHVNNLFVDEDANNAVAGTTLAASWLNSLQLELINILIAAGIDPEKADDTQLAQAFAFLGGSKAWADITDKPLEFPSSDAFGGDDQELVDKKTVRLSGNTYTNNTTRPIQVLLGKNNIQDAYFYIEGVEVAYISDASGNPSSSFNVMIPVGFTYKYVGNIVVYWHEITSNLID